MTEPAVSSNESNESRDGGATMSSQDVELNAEASSDAAAAEEKPNPHAEQIIKLSNAMFRVTLLWGGITTVVGALLFTVLFGTSGLFGSLVGSAVAFASAFVTILLMRKTAHLPPSFIMVAALGGYTGKLIVVFVVLALLRGVDALHPKALAFTMLAAIMVAAVAEFRAFKQAKIPTLIVS